MKLRKHILSVGAALLALFMALCLSSCQTGNGPSGGETQRDTTGNVTPPVAVRVIGTLPQVEGRSGVCVLNVTEVLNDGTDARRGAVLQVSVARRQRGRQGCA